MQKRNIYFDKKLYPLSYHYLWVCAMSLTYVEVRGHPEVSSVPSATLFGPRSLLFSPAYPRLSGPAASEDSISLSSSYRSARIEDTHYCVRFYVGSRQPNPGPHSQMVISPLRLSFRYGFSEAWKANTPLNIQEISSHWQLLQRTIVRSEQEIHFAFWYGCKFYLFY